MKVLIINGSPRVRGNSYNLMRYLTQLLDKHSIQYSVFEAGITYTHPCNHCGYCSTGHCCIHDEFWSVIESFNDYTDVIWITPIYFFQMTGQSKVCIDRLGASPFWKYKNFYLIAVSGSSGYLGGFDILCDVFTRVSKWHKCNFLFAYNKVTNDEIKSLTLKDKSNITKLVNLLQGGNTNEAKEN